MKSQRIKKLVNRTRKKLLSVGSQKRFNAAVLLIFALIIGGGGLYILFSHAAPTPPTIYLNPASQTLGPNGTFSVQVRENSGTTGVNAVQANFSYPSTLLTCSSIDVSASAFTVQAQSTCGSGQVTLARGVSGGSAALTGDQLVATINFTAGPTGGSATMAFTSGTALVSATTNQDILGSLAATAGGTYVIDATAPTASITAPANNAVVAFGSNVSIAATATDSQSSVTKVDIYIDGTLKTTLTTSPYNYTWSGATIGTHTIQAKATDTFNNVGSSSIVSISVTDQTAPTTSITAPAASAFVGGSTVTVSGTAADNVGVANVQFKLDGVSLGSLLTTSPYSVTWNTTTATNGSHSLTAVAKDAAGNTTTSAAVSVTVDNAAPTVSMTAPAAGATITGTTTVSATATDNTGGSGIAKVEFYIDSVLKFTSTTSPYSFSWDSTTATFGSHTLTAKAYDKVSPANTATSAGVSVSVNNAKPGDINGDGVVDVLDLSILLTNYGTTSASSDLNHDGIVNIFDLSILLTNYGL
jgi:hypothetical protein